MAEQRKFLRLDTRTLIRWDKDPSGLGKAPANLDTMRNISRAGVCLTTSRILVKGDVLNLEIKLSGNNVIRVRGAVTWIKELNPDDLDHEEEYDVGVELLDISSPDREELSKFVFGSFIHQ